MIGETIGKYRIVEPIGRGGVSTVYRAMNQETGRPVAIKVLNTATVDSVQLLRFEREADALTRLAHPGIAALLDLVDHGRERLMQAGRHEGEIDGAYQHLPDGQSQRRHLERPAPDPQRLPDEGRQDQVQGRKRETADAQGDDDGLREARDLHRQPGAQQERRAAQDHETQPDRNAAEDDHLRDLARLHRLRLAVRGQLHLAELHLDAVLVHERGALALAFDDERRLALQLHGRLRLAVE